MVSFEKFSAASEETGFFRKAVSDFGTKFHSLSVSRGKFFFVKVDRLNVKVSLKSREKHSIRSILRTQ
jgi:EAL domain-containing protein (putative c-di-GMP-specific phosphodiesterase class I)